MFSLPGASTFEVISIWSVLAIAFFGLGYALILRKQIMACDKGTEKMQEVWGAISEGANAYLKRQLKTKDDKVLPKANEIIKELYEKSYRKLFDYLIEKTKKYMIRLNGLLT